MLWQHRQHQTRHPLAQERDNTSPWADTEEDACMLGEESDAAVVVPCCQPEPNHRDDAGLHCTKLKDELGAVAVPARSR